MYRGLPAYNVSVKYFFLNELSYKGSEERTGFFENGKEFYPEWETEQKLCLNQKE